MTPDESVNHQINVATAILWITEAEILRLPIDEAHLKEIVDSARELAVTVVHFHKCLRLGGELPSAWKENR